MGYDKSMKINFGKTVIVTTKYVVQQSIFVVMYFWISAQMEFGR